MKNWRTTLTGSLGSAISGILLAFGVPIEIAVGACALTTWIVSILAKDAKDNAVAGTGM